MKAKIHPLKINFEIQITPELKLPRFVNLFCIEGESLHLIDSGVSDAMDDIQLFTEKIGRKLTEIKTIVLTHSHPDHIGAAKLIREKTGCKIYAPSAEANWIENTELQFQQRPVPGFHKLVAGDIKVDHKINDGEFVALEKNIVLQAISTPGHSVGSTSYFLKEEKALFSGDAILLPGEIPIFEDIQQYFYSLEKIKSLKPGTIYSAWDQIRREEEIMQIIDQSANYIHHIQTAAQKVAKQFSKHNSPEFCEAVLSELELNKNMTNPLLLKSFLSCL
jgi:glyoxylase-like metal-dependent hydrolase (beta-lactamase superfamily II)